jgi:hypothetical protein
MVNIIFQKISEAVINFSIQESRRKEIVDS